MSGQLTFPKTIIFPEWDLFCLVQQYHESSPKFPPVPISSWALQDKIGAQWEKCLPNYAKLILFFLNTFFWTIQPSGLLIEKPFIIHHALCQLLRLLSLQVSVPSLKSRTQHSACTALSGKHDPYQFCAPLSCSPFAFTGVWCLCAKNSVHKRFLKPSQTMPANNLFWTNPMLSHGHYQLKLKYDLLYVKSCAKIQVDFEKRRARNSHPDTFRQILQIPTRQKDPKCPKFASSKHFQTNDINSQKSTCLNMSQLPSPTWILPSARFLRHISR